MCLIIATSHGSSTLLAVYRPGSAPITGKLRGVLFPSEKHHYMQQPAGYIGDFNIHLEYTSELSSLRFLDLPSHFCLCQRVGQFTHLHGGSAAPLFSLLPLMMRSSKISRSTLRPSLNTRSSNSHFHLCTVLENSCQVLNASL